ncbi:MAG: hypothetical protein OXG11_14040 [Chloroflexi bacterium]|nr:hypothetical protein [Chloroflexota bacterium]
MTVGAVVLTGSGRLAEGGRFANRPYGVGMMIWIPAPRFRGDMLRRNDGSWRVLAWGMWSGVTV